MLLLHHASCRVHRLLLRTGIVAVGNAHIAHARADAVHSPASATAAGSRHCGTGAWHMLGVQASLQRAADVSVGKQPLWSSWLLLGSLPAQQGTMMADLSNNSTSPTIPLPR